MTAKNILIDLLKKDSLSFKGKDNLFSFISASYDLPLEQIKHAYSELERNGQILELDKNHFI